MVPSIFISGTRYGPSCTHTHTHKPPFNSSRSTPSLASARPRRNPTPPRGSWLLPPGHLTTFHPCSGESIWKVRRDRRGGRGWAVGRGPLMDAGRRVGSTPSSEIKRAHVCYRCTSAVSSPSCVSDQHPQLTAAPALELDTQVVPRSDVCTAAPGQSRAGSELVYTSPVDTLT